MEQEEGGRVQLVAAFSRPGYSAYALFNLSRGQRISRLFRQVGSEVAVLSLVFSKVFPELTAVPGAILALMMAALLNVTFAPLKCCLNGWRNTKRAQPFRLEKCDIVSNSGFCDGKALPPAIILQHHHQKSDIALNIFQTILALGISFGVRQLKDYYQMDDCVSHHMSQNTTTVAQQLRVVAVCVSAYPVELIMLFSAYTVFFLLGRGLSYCKNKSVPLLGDGQKSSPQCDDPKQPTPPGYTPLSNGASIV